MPHYKRQVLSQEVDNSEYSHWQGLVSLFHDAGNVPLKEGQSVFEVRWVCEVENPIHTERCHDRFVQACALAHTHSV